MAMKAAQHSLAEQSGGRFLLGIGISHQLLVEEWRGHAYGPPLTRMRETIEIFRQAGVARVGIALNPDTPVERVADVLRRELREQRELLAGTTAALRSERDDLLTRIGDLRGEGERLGVGLANAEAQRDQASAEAQLLGGGPHAP